MILSTNVNQRSKKKKSYLLSKGDAFQPDIFSSYRSLRESFRKIIRELQLLIIGCK